MKLEIDVWLRLLCYLLLLWYLSMLVELWSWTFFFKVEFIFLLILILFIISSLSSNLFTSYKAFVKYDISLIDLGLTCVLKLLTTAIYLSKLIYGSLFLPNEKPPPLILLFKFELTLYYSVKKSTMDDCFLSETVLENSKSIFLYKS